MNPISLSWPLSAKRTASQRNVASVSPSCLKSSRVRTLAASSAPRPANATAVRSSFRVPAKTHPETMSANATATTFSSRLRGPMVRSASRAAAGASGVSFTSGG